MQATIRPGTRFGRLVVVIPRGRVTKKDGKQRRDYSPLCICDCGNWCSPTPSNLRRGLSQSCGCGVRKAARNRFYLHGMTRSPEHNSWVNMRQRCLDPNSHAWDDYGGRGIRVCERWANSFLAFYEDMGPKPTPQHSIDRRENDGNYTPENCRWSTRVEQSRNTRSNLWLMVDGERMILSAAAELLGIPNQRVRGRRARGWPPERWFEPSTAVVSLAA